MEPTAMKFHEEFHVCPDCGAVVQSEAVVGH